jgi:site-specific recombinase XerD
MDEVTISPSMTSPYQQVPCKFNDDYGDTAMLFKPTYRDKKTGVRKMMKFWYARINGKRYPLRVTDKQVALTKASQLLLRIEGGDDPSRQQAAKKASIAEHLDSFEQSLRNKGCGDQHISQILARLGKVFKGCSVTRLADIRWEVIENWLAKQQEDGRLSSQTRRHHASHLRQFGKYLVHLDILPTNPFKKITTSINVEVDRRVRRRALTVDEFQQLLASVAKSKRQRCRMNGLERRRLYWLAGATGLRRNELGSLTPESFSLKSVPPTVSVEARRAKNRKCALLPLREDLANELRKWLEKKPKAKALFPVTGRPTGAMIRADLKDAGVEAEILGRRVDFHALRVTFISSLARNGVALAVAQKLARHSTPVLTANVYTALDLNDLAKAVESIPPLATESAKKTRRHPA